MTRQDSLTFAELLDWLEGRLPPDQAQAVAERVLTAGAATQADLAWLRAFTEARQAVRLANPPGRVRVALRRQFAALPGGRGHTEPEPGSAIQRFLASLTFDSRQQPATPGLRSAAAEGQQRQLIFSTPVAEIALNLQPEPGGQRVSLSGQVFPVGEDDAPLPTAAPTFSIQVLRAGDEVALTTADDLGEFSLPPLPAGNYDLVVSSAEAEITLPTLPVRL